MNKDIIIIGAGPAGLVCGKHLLNHGYSVTIIERATFPRVVVGESLLPISMEHFEEVGFLEDLSKENWEVKKGATFIQGDRIFEIDFSKQFTKNARTWTWQVPRAKFDQILAQNFINAGGRIHFGSTITDLSIHTKVNCTFSNSEKSIQIEGDFLVDSSGFSGVTSRFFNKPIHKDFLNNSSIFCHFEDKNLMSMSNPKRISFDILDQDLWLWVIPFHEDIASVGIVGDNKYFDLGGNGENQLRNFIEKSDRYKERFHSQKALFESKIIQNYSQSSQELFGDKYCLIGNTAEFLDPIFSSGVAFATGSGLKAAKCIIQEFEGNNTWDSYKEFMAQGVDTFKTYVNAWYDGDLQTIFFTDYPKSKEMEEQITSILAGYVWDQSNPFVLKAESNVKKLASFLRKMEH